MLTSRSTNRVVGAVLALLLAALSQGCGSGETSATGGTGGTGGVQTTGTGGEPCPAGSHDEGGVCTASLAEWTAGPSLAARRDHHISFVVETEQGPFAYVGAGVTDLQTLLKSVERAPIQADGSLGAWAAAGDMPIKAGGRAVAVIGSHVVAMGGHLGFALSDRTDVGAVAADGAITWTQGPSMAHKRFHGAAASVGDNVYVVGGLTDDGTNNIPSVEMAKLGADGALAAWTETTPLPEKRSHHGLAVTEKALYVTGGLQGDPAALYKSLDDVLFAPILEDGSVGAWAPAGTLPTYLATHSSFVHLGYLYVVGGIDKVDALDSVSRAPILEDGTLGAWETLPSLPKQRAHGHQSLVHGGFVYCPGGAIDHKSYADVFVGRFE